MFPSQNECLESIVNAPTFKVDSEEGRRQSKMTANPKSHAVSQTAYAEADVNLYAVWETAYGVKGLSHKCTSLLFCMSSY